MAPPPHAGAAVGKLTLTRPTTKKLRIIDTQESRRICKLYHCVLRSELDELVKRQDPKALNYLAKLFPAAKYPAVQESAHCFYCCSSFDPRDKRSECSLEHEIEWERDFQTGGGSHWTAECRRCCERFSGMSSSYDEPPDDLGRGYCYQGPHGSSKEALGQVLEWHTEEHGQDEPFDCKICEAKRLEYLRDDDNDSDHSEDEEDKENTSRANTTNQQNKKSAPPASNTTKSKAKSPATKKKSSFTKQTLVSEGPPTENLAGGWPEGWYRRVFARSNTSSGRKKKNQTDKYWFSPVEGIRFRSMAEVRRFLKALKSTRGDEHKAKAIMNTIKL